MSDMKLIMERWDRYLQEDIEQPATWGDLAQNIMLAKAAEKWPRLGKKLLKFGVKVVTSKVKRTIDMIEDLEDILDFVPDEMQQALEAGTDKSVQWLSQQARTRGGRIGAFIVDDIMGMDDSLTKDLPGYSQLNLEDEYENLVDKSLLKKWAKAILKQASQENPDTPLPDLNKKLEDFMQDKLGAHPDIDAPDVRSET
tara:strand:+ start:173 stop:766 length:594 start_codon:yes stop_codon:yes gene_type:complete